METLLNVVLGLLFLALGVVNTLLMFHLWGYPFDHATHRSSAPRWLMRVHRATGYAFLLIYLYLMAQMLPRIWHYQIELPPRTVMHLTLGLAIGIILFVKIGIVRFFKHLESSLVPMLGVALLICTVLLVGLSVPFVLKEQYLSQQAFGSVLSAENLARLKTLLPRAGLPAEADVDALASVRGLETGRRVLLSKCVQCHDLRTVLVRPKTPEAWLQTVNRMGDRAVIGKPIDQAERWHVATYLIAISPDLRQALIAKREQDLESQETLDAVRNLPSGARVDMDIAKQTFASKCVQCHALPSPADIPAEEAKSLVTRMVTNGLVATQEELTQIVAYLSAKPKTSAGSAAVSVASGDKH
jgi:mono/diheme cytochrome c family protein